MKIEKINLNKIKVTFTSDDLIEHNLTVSAVKENAPWLQRVLMNVVRRAEEEVGFSAENARLMVEAMPAEGDCMVMYITRLGADEEIKDVLSEVKKRVRLRVRPAADAAKEALITFDSFEDALKLAHFASDYDEGELYFYNDRYHLLINHADKNRFSEFGTMTSDEKICDLVSEHGKKVCSYALRTLRENF